LLTARIGAQGAHQAAEDGSGPCLEEPLEAIREQGFLRRDPAYRGDELAAAELFRFGSRADHPAGDVRVDGERGIGKREWRERLVEFPSRIGHERRVKGA